MILPTARLTTSHSAHATVASPGGFGVPFQVAPRALASSLGCTSITTAPTTTRPKETAPGWTGSLTTRGERCTVFLLQMRTSTSIPPFPRHDPRSPALPTPSCQGPQGIPSMRTSGTSGCRRTHRHLSPFVLLCLRLLCGIVCVYVWSPCLRVHPNLGLWGTPRRATALKDLGYRTMFAGKYL